MHLELSRYYSVYICGDVCLHICRCNWVCTCTECCKFAYVCAWENERERERERARNKKVCERWCLPLYTHTSDKLSVLFCAASDAFHLFRARRQKSVLGKWRAWICLPGTRWDCVIIVGSWSFFFLPFFWDSECKDTDVSILSPGSWKKTSIYYGWETRWSMFW